MTHGIRFQIEKPVNRKNFLELADVTEGSLRDLWRLWPDFDSSNVFDYAREQEWLNTVADPSAGESLKTFAKSNWQDNLNFALDITKDPKWDRSTYATDEEFFNTTGSEVVNIYAELLFTPYSGSPLDFVISETLLEFRVSVHVSNSVEGIGWNLTGDDPRSPPPEIDWNGLLGSDLDLRATYEHLLDRFQPSCAHADRPFFQFHRRALAYVNARVICAAGVKEYDFVH